MSEAAEIATCEVQRVGEEPPRPLTQAELYLLEASSEVAFTRRRREIAVSEADAARAELVGCEYRAMALAHEARRARMPRVLPALAVHGDMRQVADGLAGPIGAGEVSNSKQAQRPREEMGAPPAPAAPTTWQRLLGWVTGRPPLPPAPPVLKSYVDGDLPPGQRARADQTAYSLDRWGLTPRRTASSPDEALGKRGAALAQGLLRTVK